MKNALVFSGGGARGAYQMGVWSAMREMNLTVDIVCGTSIGALNGVLFAQGDYELALEIWMNMSPDLVFVNGVNIDFDIDLLMNQRPQLELFVKQFIHKKRLDITPLKQLIAKCLKEETLRNSSMQFGLCTVEIPSKPVLLSIDEIPERKVGDFLLASASCFPVFPLCLIDGRYYIDGGYYENVPMTLAKQMGAEHFIIVDMSSKNSLQFKYRENPAVIYICPYYELNSFLNFDGEIARNNIRLGYLDSLKRFQHQMGFVYFFDAKNVLEHQQYLSDFIATQNLLQNYFDQHSLLRTFFARSIQSRIHTTTMMKEYQEEFSFALRCCEIAGELLGISRYEIHDFDAFHQEMRKRFLQIDQSFLDVPINLQELMELRKGLDSTLIIVFLLHQLGKLVRHDKRIEELVFMLSLRRNEILAAIYLFSFLSHENNTEKEKTISVK